MVAHYLVQFTLLVAAAGTQDALDVNSFLQLGTDTDATLNVAAAEEGGDLATVHNRTDLLQTDLPFWHGAVRGFGAQRGQTNVLQANYPLWEVLQNHSDTHWQRLSGRRLRRPRARSSHKASLMRGIIDCLKKLFTTSKGAPAGQDNGINLKEQLNAISSEEQTNEILAKIKSSDTKGAITSLQKVLPFLSIADASSEDELFAISVLKANKKGVEVPHIRNLFKSKMTKLAIRDTVAALIHAKAKSSVITVATLNVGGDGPQPEYLGSAWEKAYGDVEVTVGAKILLAFSLEGNNCNTAKVDEKFKARYGTMYKQFCERLGSSMVKAWAQTPVQETLKDFVPADILKQLFEVSAEKSQMANVFHDTEDDFQFVPFEDGTTWTAFSTYLMDEKTTKYVRSPKLSSLDKEKECKRRRAFPFFGTSFVQMYTEYLKMYNADPATKETEKAKATFFNAYKKMMSWDGKTCDYLRANRFAPLFLFDLFVMQEFQGYLDGKEPEAVPIPSDEEVKEKKRQIVRLLAPGNADVDVLFLQEAEDVLDVKGAALALAETQPRGIIADGKVDTAILAANKFVASSVAQEWKNFAPSEFAKLLEEPEQPFLTPYGNEKLSNKDGKLDAAKATTVAVTSIDGHNVLLVSQHPNSNGRPCVLYATLARKFFDSVKDGMKLDLMLVGMDANVMAESDKTFKKKGTPKKDDPKENGFDWGQFKRGVETLGFKVVHAEKETDSGRTESVDTVYKIRTFLQSQFAKAAKVDKTTKDIILAYPQKMVKKFQAEVKNDISGAELTYNTASDQKYPTDTWVLDHFATRARITIDWEAK